MSRVVRSENGKVGTSATLAVCDRCKIVIRLQEDRRSSFSTNPPSNMVTCILWNSYDFCAKCTAFFEHQLQMWSVKPSKIIPDLEDQLKEGAYYDE